MRSNNTFDSWLTGKVLFFLGALVLVLLVLGMGAEAGYDQEVNDPEDDVIDTETEETTDQYPEIDILSVVTSKVSDTEVSVEVTFKANVATSGKYTYGVYLTDGKEDSEHTARVIYLPGYGMNQISYDNGGTEEDVKDVVIINEDTITVATSHIDITKCGIAEEDFTIDLDGTGASIYDQNFEDTKYADVLGEITAEEGCKTTVEIINNGDDEHVNDILVTVLYEDGSRAEEPVEDAEVTLYSAFIEGKELRSGTTDANGELLFENLVPGDYMLVVVDDQYEDYNQTFYAEVLIDDTPIFKVWAERHNIDKDETYTDGKVVVYYGSLFEQQIQGADVYMDGEYQGESGDPFLEIEGPIAEGLHLIRAEYEDDVAYCSLHIESKMGDGFSEEMHISLVQEDGDVDDDEENDILVTFTDDESGDPIPGVDIYLDDELMGTTDVNGEVIRKNLTDGYHEVTATYDGDDYFWYLLIGMIGTHELGDFDFDGEENDMKFTAEVGGLSMPHSTFVIFEDTRNGEPGPLAVTSFNGVGYVQDLEEDDYHAGIVNMMVGVVQFTEFNFSVEGAGEDPTLLIDTDLPDEGGSEGQGMATITVSSDSRAVVEGASVTIEVTGAGSSDKTEGVTDANGQFTFTLTMDNVTEEDSELTVKIAVSKDGYEDGEYEKEIIVYAWIEPKSHVTEPKKHNFGDGNNATVVAGIKGNGEVKVKSGTQPDAEDKHAMGLYLNVSKEGGGDLEWVNITIDYDDVPDGIDPAKLKMYYWNETGDKWELVENSGVDTVNKFVWANLTHLTLFAPREQVEADTTAPIITHDPVLDGYAGQPIDPIFAEITDDGDGVAGAELYYRKSTDTEYTKYDMTIGEGGYYGKIPREFVTLDGVDYYIKATDGTNEALDPGVDMYHYIDVTEATGNGLPEIAFRQPVGGETLSEKIEITWTASDPDGDNLQFMLSLSSDSGATWQPVYGSLGYYPTVVENYTFDTTDTENGVDTPNGNTYRFMLELFDDGDPALSSAVQTGDFTIENAVVENQAPVIGITYPAGGETVSGTINVAWTATDPDGDIMMYTVKLSKDSGATWEDIAVNLHSLVQLKQALDTTQYANGDTYRIKLVVTDSGVPIMTSELEGADFTINNAGGDELPEEEDDDSPGFELLGMVAVVAVVAIISRKRR